MKRPGATGRLWQLFNIKAAEPHGYGAVPEEGHFHLQVPHIPVLPWLMVYLSINREKAKLSFPPISHTHDLHFEKLVKIENTVNFLPLNTLKQIFIHQKYYNTNKTKIYLYFCLVCISLSWGNESYSVFLCNSQALTQCRSMQAQPNEVFPLYTDLVILAEVLIHV